ncbi:hypothetical protein HMI54_013406 [Coelomomyces lativittatus]|nr:hypothetical protein HMI54_013406 [Coelomomyces lativittatus]
MLFNNNKNHNASREGEYQYVYVRKRPYLDEFLNFISTRFEVAVFTASIAQYADPVISALDKYNVVQRRFFRDSCISHDGQFIKSLHLLGRDLKEVVMIDNCEIACSLNQENAIPISTWYNDHKDTALLNLVPLLEQLHHAHNVVSVLREYHTSINHFPSHELCEIKTFPPTNPHKRPISILQECA